MDVKTCNTCGILKELSEFHSEKQASSGKKARCSTCRNIAVKRSRYKMKYGLTLEETATLKAGGCMVCGATTGTMHIDHDHSKGLGTHRGCLCVICNHLEGRIKDGYKLPTMEQFTKYLER